VPSHVNCKMQSMCAGCVGGLTFSSTFCERVFVSCNGHYDMTDLVVWQQKCTGLWTQIYVKRIAKLRLELDDNYNLFVKYRYISEFSKDSSRNFHTKLREYNCSDFEFATWGFECSNHVGAKASYVNCKTQSMFPWCVCGGLTFTSTFCEHCLFNCSSYYAMNNTFSMNYE